MKKQQKYAIIYLFNSSQRLQKLPKKYIKHAAVRLFVIYNRPGYGDAGISEQENIKKMVIIGQSVGGYVGQTCAQLHPDKLKSFVFVHSVPLKRKLGLCRFLYQI